MILKSRNISITTLEIKTGAMTYSINKFRNNILGLFLIFGLTVHARVYKHDLIHLGSSYNTSTFCNPQSTQFSINIDGNQLQKNHIYKIIEDSYTNYYLVVNSYSYGDQGFRTITPDSVTDLGLQSSLCQQSSAEFYLYKLGFYGASTIDCEDQPQGEEFYNIETAQILQENYVYSLTVNGSTYTYLVLDVLPPSQGYSELIVSDVQKIGHFDQICNNGSTEGPVSPSNESFESSLGQWSNDSQNNGAWIRDSGGTPTSYTGPTAGSSGSYYAYAEANNYSYTASFESRLLYLTKDNSQFLFDYHMMGQSMGNLVLEISIDKGLNWLELWRKEGDQRSQWIPAIIDLSVYEYEEIKLRFKAERGPNYQSDMAIDNVRFNARSGGIQTSGQTSLNSNENYVHQMTLRDPVLAISNIDGYTRRVESVTYFDGLGRPKQSVELRAGGTQEDIITPVAYDHLGREKYNYLPYSVSSSSKGGFDPNAVLNQSNFYNTDKYDNTTNPYWENLFDTSPKNLKIEKGAPGNPWKLSNQEPKSQKKEYRLLTLADNVKHFSVEYNSTVDPFKPTLVDNGLFMSQQGTRPALLKFVTKNENWKPTDQDVNTTQTFVDYQNRTLLKREFVLKNSGVQKVDTYFVYDNFGNLVYTITPEAKASSISPSQAVLDAFCYQYKYDSKNRLVEKKLPGKMVEYMVYNKVGSPIMKQDGELRKKDQWQFLKYDDLGRVIYTGLLNSSSSRAIHQLTADGASTLFETRKSSSPITSGGVQLYYTNNSYPASGISEVLTIQYYDLYLPSIAHGYHSRPSVNDFGESLTARLKSLATVSRVKILGTSNPIKWINTTSGYDKYGRVVWSKKVNEHLSATTTVHYDLDFDGSVLKTKTAHNKSDIALTVQLNDYFKYDHRGRMKEHSQKINSEPTELIQRYFYDGLGQLKKKQVGGDVGSLGLQEVDFKYNIRGWLRAVNDVNSLGADVFAYKLNYNNREMNLSGTYDLFNGNISEIIWRSGNTETYGDRKRGYGYSYDALNRITNAYFRRATSSGAFIEQTNHYNVTGINYDFNGNIHSLIRKGIYNSSNHIGTVDNLIYQYNGNKLVNVTDNSGSVYGFKDVSNTMDFAYDDNGNLIKDLNRAIPLIKYNHLNLPEYIYANEYLQNIYSATGEKLEKYNQETGTRTYYDGNFVFKKAEGVTSKLTFFHQPEGYVEVNAGNFQYVYQFKDHLGNIRVNFADANNDNKISPASNELLDEKNYYPFGLEHKGYNSTALGQYHNYGFNGNEEINELSLDLMDFNARNYNPSLGRFLSFDPMAEEQDQIHISPYAFGWNNPIKLADPTGMHPDWNNEDYQQYREMMKSAGKYGIKTYIFNASDDLMNALSGGKEGEGDPTPKRNGPRLALGHSGVQVVGQKGSSDLLNQSQAAVNNISIALSLGSEYLSAISSSGTAFSRFGGYLKAFSQVGSWSSIGIDIANFSTNRISGEDFFQKSYYNIFGLINPYGFTVGFSYWLMGDVFGLEEKATKDFLRVQNMSAEEKDEWIQGKLDSKRGSRPPKNPKLF